MKKITLLIAITIGIMLNYSCTNDQILLNPSNNLNEKKDWGINDAKKWYESHSLNMNAKVFSDSLFKISKIKWDEAFTTEMSVGKTLLIPIEFNNNFIPRIAEPEKGKSKKIEKEDRKIGVNEFSSFMVYKDSTGAMQGEIVTVIPDDSFYSKKNKGELYKFSGYVWVRKIDGTFSKGFEYKNGKLKGNVIIGDNISSKKGKVKYEYPCGEIPVFVNVCTPAFNDCDYHYSHSIPVICQTENSDYSPSPTPDDYMTGGGGNSSGSSAGLTYNNLVYGGDSDPPVINNIVNELLCMMQNSTSGTTYQISICVDQPIPNSTSAFSGTNVGHTFIQFIKTHISSGTQIKRNVGFYPSNGLSALTGSTSSAIKDNSNTKFDVSVTYNVNATQFTNGINKVLNWGNHSYNLEYFNCTDAAYEVVNAAGITVPTPLSKIIIPAPNNTVPFLLLFIHSPGALGESLRTLPSSNNYSKNTSGGTNYKSGSCD